jgi:8-oxo-dGTP pyrophosphatase MutT (NUDIX family)
MSSLESLLGRVIVTPPGAVIERARALARAEDATDRNRFAPGHFTASGLVVSPDRSSLLLVHHRRLGRWVQPGGHIDPGDGTPLEAARREVLEETGVATTPLVEALFAIDIHGIPSRGPEPGHEHFDLRFALTGVTDEVTPADEVRDAVWASWEDLGDFEVDDSVARAAMVLRGMTQRPR